MSKKKSDKSVLGQTLRQQSASQFTQPIEVWSASFELALKNLMWPKRVSPETSFLWSAVTHPQAEVLVRAGLPAKKLADIVSDKSDDTPDELAEKLGEVTGLMASSLEEQANDWLSNSATTPDAALGLVALAWNSPGHGKLEGNDWLSNWMQAIAELPGSAEIDAEDCILVRLITGCELPLLLALANSSTGTLPETTQAMDSLAEYLECAADDPSVWVSHGATYLRAALASVLRCRVLADALGCRSWFPPQQKALVELLIHAARWSRPDGTQLLAAGNSSPKSQAIWDALVAQTGIPKKLSAALCLSGVGHGNRTEIRNSVPVTKLPALCQYSEPANCAVTQSDWRQKGSRVAFDYSDASMRIEALGPKGKPILAGAWELALEVEGKLQSPREDWQEICWFSDDDVDYLELEAQIGNDFRVQRQFALFREERLLYLADSVISKENADLALRSAIPLAPGTTYESNAKTTEGFIDTPSTRSLVLPIYLPEWRRQLSIDNSENNLQYVDDSLVATVRSQAKRLYNPMLISLCTSHAKQEFTWRHLTVGEDLRIVRRDEAQAYRIQIGSDQWFVYRNLDEPIRRTALGFHTLDDFFAGRFDPGDGGLETIVQVEPQAEQGTR